MAVRTAIILAAGLGSRMGDLIAVPKGFIKLGSQSLIDRSLGALFDHGIEKVVIGTGHLQNYYEEIAASNSKVLCAHNPKYASTGSLQTLGYCQPLVEGEDALLLESDIVYDPKGLASLLASTNSNVILASGPTKSSDEVFIEASSDQRLVNMSKKESELGSIYGELTGISKINGVLLRDMRSLALETGLSRPKMDYEDALVELTSSHEIHIELDRDFIWAEIDDESHLKRAQTKILPHLERV